MRNKRRFLAKFAGYSILLFAVWVGLADVYVRMPMAVAHVLLRLSGATDVSLAVGHRTVFLSGGLGGGGLSVLDVTLNTVFFVALGLATVSRGSPAERSWKPVALGLGILLAFQGVVLTSFGYGFGHQASIAASAAKALSAFAKFLLPILLWILLFYFPSRTGA